MFAGNERFIRWTNDCDEDKLNFVYGFFFFVKKEKLLDSFQTN